MTWHPIFAFAGIGALLIGAIEAAHGSPWYVLGYAVLGSFACFMAGWCARSETERDL